jgi:tol-pal system protein YbgF
VNSDAFKSHGSYNHPAYREAIMPTHAVLLAGFLVAPALAGGNKDIERLYLQMAALQSEVTQLHRTSDDTLKELHRLNEVLADQNALVKKNVQDQQRLAEANQITLKDIAESVASLRDRLQATVVAGPGPATLTREEPLTALPPGTATSTAGPCPAPGTTAGPADKELYTQAYADFARGNYDLAIQAFQEFIKRWPTDHLANNAQYWIGECLFGKRQYAEAVAAWDEMLRQYPGTDKIPDAHYKKALALERMGRKSQALLEYRYVSEHFPNTEAGRKARERLQSQ